MTISQLHIAANSIRVRWLLFLSLLFFAVNNALGIEPPPSERSNTQLGTRSAAIIDRLPAPQVDTVLLNQPCVNSSWRFVDEESASAWKRNAGVDNNFGLVMNQLMHWARAHLPEQRFWSRGTSATGSRTSKPCIDTDFVARTWQGTFGFPVSGTLSLNDLKPLNQILAKVDSEPEGDRPPKDRPKLELTEIRTGLTFSELKPFLQPWCKASKGNPTDTVCAESTNPCNILATNIKNLGDDIKEIESRMQNRRRNLSNVDPRYRHANDTVNALNFEMKNDQKRLEGKQDLVSNLIAKSHKCLITHSDVPLYTIEGVIVEGTRFVFENGRMSTVRFGTDRTNSDSIKKGFFAHYGAPELRTETTTEHYINTTTELEPCFTTDSAGCISAMIITEHHNHTPREWQLGTWRSRAFTISEHPYYIFEIRTRAPLAFVAINFSKLLTPEILSPARAEN